MEEDQKELQLLPTPHATASSSHKMVWPPRPSDHQSSMKFQSSSSDINPFEGPSLDLQLSISVRRPVKQPSECVLVRPTCGDYTGTGGIEALKWKAEEQIRLAAIEKAYAERVRELTRREMELAQSEFARARNMWEIAREEGERADKMKERATRKIDSSSMEITCQSCRQKFRP